MSISSDDSFPSVPSSAMDSMVGQYARVRMVAGVAAGRRQRAGTTAGRSVEGVDVGPGAVVGRADGAAGGLPTGADRDPEDVRRRRRRRCWSRRRSPRCHATWASWSAGGDSNQSTVALSVEVPPESAAVVGSADEVAVAVLASEAPFPAAATSRTLRRLRRRRWRAADGRRGGGVRGGRHGHVDDVRVDVGVVDAVGAAGAVRRVRPVRR